MQAGSWLRRSAREEASRTLRRATGEEVNGAPSRVGRRPWGGDRTGRERRKAPAAWLRESGDAWCPGRPQGRSRRRSDPGNPMDAERDETSSPGIAARSLATGWGSGGNAPGNQVGRRRGGEKSPRTEARTSSGPRRPGRSDEGERRRRFSHGPIGSPSRKTRSASPDVTCVVGDGTPREAGGFARSRPPSEGASRSRRSREEDGRFLHRSRPPVGREDPTGLHLKGWSSRTGRAEAAAYALPVPAGQRPLERHPTLRSNAVRS